MPALRFRNAVLLAKAEAVEGTPETPAAATDAVLVENFRINFNPNLTETDEVTGSLDPRSPIQGGLGAELSFDCYLKHSGTAGTIPEIAALLKACGLLETITAAAVGAPTAATAGTATAVTAQAPFAATAQLYRHMPLILAGNPAAGAITFIKDYTVGRVATLTDTFSPVLSTSTTLQVPINVLYTPHSGTIPSLTMWFYMDGLLYKFYGCRGNMSLNVRSGGPGKLSFRFTGLFLSKTDAAIVTPTLQSTRPPIWRDASDNGYGAAIINYGLAGIASFSLDMGNVLTYPENPNNTEGFDPGVITRRRITGSIDPIETLVATRDIMGDFRAGTQRHLHFRLGATAGNRIGLTIPTAQYLGQQPSERGGLATVDVPFFVAGEDSASLGLCFY
jgi:hypothetical protein